MTRSRLRSGFTTGTAAAAAVKAALLALTRGEAPPSVHVPFLSVGGVDVPVHTADREGEGTAVCTVIKDAGDDPDATHGAEIGARVKIETRVPGSGDGLLICGGAGVGRITLPGLEMPPGQAAINPGPRRMIDQAVSDVLGADRKRFRVWVEVFVPHGEAIATRTLNARLGILGGISILGTTGIVRPMSHEAYTATIVAAMHVARAEGLSALVLTTGRRSERFAQALWPAASPRAFVQIGDYFGFSLETAASLDMGAVNLAVFFGKAVKMAQDIAQTHAHATPMALSALAQWTRTATGDADLARAVGSANTARQALDLIMPRHRAVVDAVGRRVIAAARRMTGEHLAVGAVIFDFNGQPIFQETA